MDRSAAVDRLVLVDEVTSTLLTYCNLVDANRQGDVLDLFLDDATYDHGHGRIYTGRSELAQLFAQLDANDATSHHLSNVQVQLLDGGTATSWSYVYAYHRRSGTGQVVHLWGRYADTLVRTADVWRFRTRTLLAAAEGGIAPDPGWSTRYQHIERFGRDAE